MLNMVHFFLRVRKIFSAMNHPKGIIHLSPDIYFLRIRSKILVFLLILCTSQFLAEHQLSLYQK